MLRLEARWPVTNPEVCTRIRRALVPDILFLIHVPDRDCDRQPLPQHEFIAHFERSFSILCGGHAPTAGGMANYKGRVENTVIVSTYLPELVNLALQEKLLELLLDFGVQANQEEVLAAVGVFACRLRFARTRADQRKQVAEVALRKG